ncbi:hypothetical protein FPRO05_14377 [Fusarium proliferatum]|uniref:Major facilitator superfamily (MFS) profile domain-containing protein n=1 Tax=Gibberella intermedia TaxID=948311 RepID=A0A365MY13_GIBIN|nr:hypothetical protein FPRO05_14377 [Fusarium proliferatum]
MSTQDASARVADSSNISDTDEAQNTSEGPHETRWMQSIGAIQSYLVLHQLNDYTNRDVGWIIGVYSFLSLLLGLQTGPLMDYYGPRVLAPAAMSFTVPMFFLLAECEEYWQFMLTFGLLGGVGAATTSTVAVSMVAKLFDRRRGAAMGCALGGACLGGVIFPILLQRTFPHLGWKWSLRIVGFIVLGMMSAGWLCLCWSAKLLNPTMASQAKTAMPNFTAFQSKVFLFITIGFSALEFAMFGISGLLPTFSSKAGYGEDVGFILLALSNGCSLFGRILPGFAADFLGHFNVLVSMILVTSIFTAALFVPLNAGSAAPLYAFASLWGFGSGSWLAMIPVCVSKTCEPAAYGRYYGTMTFCVSLAALMAVSVPGELLDRFGHKPASSVFLCIVLLGGVSLYFARSFLIKRLLGLEIVV